MVDGVAHEAGVDASNGLTLIPQQLLGEACLVDAQVGAIPVILADAREALEACQHCGTLFCRRASALEKHGRVLVHSESFCLRKKVRQRVRAIVDGLVVPGRRGKGREVVDVGEVIGRAVIAADKVHVRRHQNHAVKGDAVGRQQLVGHTTGANAAVALTEEVFRRLPATIVRDIAGNEVRHGLDVVIHAPEVFALCLTDRAGEARAHGVDHHEVSLVEHRVLVVNPTEWTFRGESRVLHNGALGTQNAHVQPHGCGAGTTVVGKHDGAGARIFVLLHIGGVAEVRDGLAIAVLHLEGACGGRVVDGSAIDAHGALTHRVQQLGHGLRVVAIHHFVAISKGRCREDSSGR